MEFDTEDKQLQYKLDLTLTKMFQCSKDAPGIEPSICTKSVLMSVLSWCSDRLASIDGAPQQTPYFYQPFPYRQELISVPFKALSDSMKKLMTSLKQVVQKVKDLLLTFKRLVLAIMSTIKSAFDWLESSLNVCNKKLGTPYERCMRVLSEACDDCKVI